MNCCLNNFLRYSIVLILHHCTWILCILFSLCHGFVQPFRQIWIAIREADMGVSELNLAPSCRRPIPVHTHYITATLDDGNSPRRIIIILGPICE